MAGGKLTEADVQAELRSFPDPETGRSVVDMGQVGPFECAPDSLRVELRLTSYSAPLWEETRAELEDRLRRRFASLRSIHVDIAEHHRPPDKLGQIGLTAKSVIAVGSGKGGVGKSTIAASLALGLQRS